MSGKNPSPHPAASTASNKLPPHGHLTTATSPYAVVHCPTTATAPPPTPHPPPRRLLVDLQTGLVVSAVRDDNTVEHLDPVQAHHYSAIMQQKLRDAGVELSPSALAATTPAAPPPATTTPAAAVYTPHTQPRAPAHTHPIHTSATITTKGGGNGPARYTAAAAVAPKIAHVPKWSLQDVQMASFNVHQALEDIGNELPRTHTQHPVHTHAPQSRPTHTHPPPLPTHTHPMPTPRPSLAQMGIPVPPAATSTPIDRHMFDSSPEPCLSDGEQQQYHQHQQQQQYNAAQGVCQGGIDTADTLGGPVESMRSPLESMRSPSTEQLSGMVSTGMVSSLEEGPPPPSSPHGGPGANGGHDDSCVMFAERCGVVAVDGTPVEQLRMQFVQRAIMQGNCGAHGDVDREHAHTGRHSLAHIQDALLVHTMLRAAGLEYSISEEEDMEEEVQGGGEQGMGGGAMEMGGGEMDTGGAGKKGEVHAYDNSGQHEQGDNVNAKEEGMQVEQATTQEGGGGPGTQTQGNNEETQGDNEETQGNDEQLQWQPTTALPNHHHHHHQQQQQLGAKQPPTPIPPPTSTLTRRTPHIALRAVLDAAQGSWMDSWVQGPVNVMDVVAMAIAATGKPAATVQEIWQVCRTWQAAAVHQDPIHCPPPAMQSFLTRIGSDQRESARAHIERVLRRSGGFVILGFTHNNDVKWARKPHDLPGVPPVRADHVGRLSREERLAVNTVLQRAETQHAGAAEAGLYRAALLGRSAVARAALVGRLAAHEDDVG